jgi:hypothetical protein
LSTPFFSNLWRSLRRALTDADVPVELRDTRLSGAYFDILGAKPMLGRTFAPDEDQLGKQNEVILSHRIVTEQVWSGPQHRSSSHPAHGAAYTIIGAMRRGTFDREREDVWTDARVQARGDDSRLSLDHLVRPAETG